MKKHANLLILAVSFLVSLTACEYKYNYESPYSTLPLTESGFQPEGDGYTYVKPLESKKDIELTRENLDNFNTWSFDIIRMTAQTHRGSSFLISPVSVASDMCLLSNSLTSDGANMLVNSTGMSLPNFQNTTREMMRYITYCNISLYYLIPVHSKRLFANAVWGNKGIDFSEIYRDGIAKMYGTPATTLNFNSSSSRKVFDSYLYDYSEGLLTDSRYPLNKNNKFQITNDFYFYAAWHYCFNPDNTYDAPFKGMTATRNVPTMHGKIFGRVLEDDRYTVVRLGFSTYKDEAMFIILPKEGVDIFDIADELTYEYIPTMMLNFSPYNIELSLPRITLDKETNVADAIYKMSDINDNTTFSIDKNVTNKDISFNGLGQQMTHHAVYNFVEDGCLGKYTNWYQDNPRLDSDMPVVNIAIDRPFMFVAMNVAYNIPLLAGIVTDVE